MKRTVFCVLSAVVIIAGLVSFIAFATAPGRAALAYLRMPQLKILKENQLISYEASAEPLASAIAGYLPEAIARIEAAEGLEFIRPVTFRVFADWKNYEKYGAGVAGAAAAVTVFDRINFSPKLLVQPERVRAVLTHELSHALLHQRIGLWSLTLPSWFNEGLAVLVSDGGGAETVPETEAVAAIHRGERFTPDESESVFGHRFGASFGLPEHMFYRQSALFVGYMRKRDPQKFKALLSTLSEPESLGAAVQRHYSMTIAQLWEEFLAAQLPVKAAPE